MTNVTQVGRNPSAPGVFMESFSPDQLIAGWQNLVTQNATIKAGLAYLRGTVMGRIITRSIASASSLTTGNGTVGNLSTDTQVVTGAYTLTATSATSFTVKDPTGATVGTATVDTPFVSKQVLFTITHGATAFAAGDAFTLTVGAESGKWVKCVKTALDGSQYPRGIMVDYVDATAADTAAGLYVAGEFNINHIISDATWTPDELVSEMQKYGITLKSALIAPQS